MKLRWLTPDLNCKKEDKLRLYKQALNEAIYIILLESDYKNEKSIRRIIMQRAKINLKTNDDTRVKAELKGEK